MVQLRNFDRWDAIRTQDSLVVFSRVRSKRAMFSVGIVTSLQITRDDTITSTMDSS